MRYFKLLAMSLTPCRDIHKEVLLAILSCWPAVLIACIMTYMAGIVVWALVSFIIAQIRTNVLTEMGWFGNDKTFLKE